MHFDNKNILNEQAQDCYKLFCVAYDFVPSDYGFKNTENQFPSMIHFQDDAKEVLHKSQKSKPFVIKRNSKPRSPPQKVKVLEPLNNTVGNDSMNVQESTIKRQNSQEESDAFNEFKSDDFYNTHNSKFMQSRR